MRWRLSLLVVLPIFHLKIRLLFLEYLALSKFVSALGSILELESEFLVLPVLDVGFAERLLEDLVVSP